MTKKSSKNIHLEVIDKKLSDYNIHWLVIVFKFIPVLIAFLWNVTVRKLICPIVAPYLTQLIFPYVKRYVESVVNLISMKFILITMGFFRF